MNAKGMVSENSQGTPSLHSEFVLSPQFPSVGSPPSEQIFVSPHAPHVDCGRDPVVPRGCLPYWCRCVRASRAKKWTPRTKCVDKGALDGGLRSPAVGEILQGRSDTIRVLTQHRSLC